MQHVPGVVLRQHGALPSVETISVADPGPNEVMVRIVASGICHTDIAAMRDARITPVLLGHEGAGIVEKVGEGVVHVQPGDHVVVNWQAKCGACRRCQSGRSDLCENVLGTAEPRVFWRGAALPVLLNAGTFSPLAVVPGGGAVPIRRDLPFVIAAMLGCAVATGVGAALYTARVRPGESVVVIGVGGVGLSVIQGARIAGARSIIAVDLNAERLDQARSVGANHTLSGDGDTVAAVRALTDGRGADHVFEVVGLPRLMQTGIDMLSRGGLLTLVGAAARDAELSFHPRKFMSQQQGICGCIYGNIHPAVDLPLFADWALSGALQLDLMHTASISLDDVPQFFADFSSYRGLRTIIEFDRP